MVESCSKLEISVREHLAEVVDKLSTTAVDLKKTTAVIESLSTTSTRCSLTEISSLLQDLNGIFFQLRAILINGSYRILQNCNFNQNTPQNMNNIHGAQNETIIMPPLTEGTIERIITGLLIALLGKKDRHWKM